MRSLLQLFVSTAVPVDYEGLLKLLVLFENVKLLESSFILFCCFVFVKDTHFKTHNANVITS